MDRGRWPGYQHNTTVAVDFLCVALGAKQIQLAPDAPDLNLKCSAC
jgi:hypothetical protein